MADIAKSGTPSLATLAPPPSNQLTKITASDIAAGDMVYIKSDDTFALASGAAATAPALWFGIASRAAKSGTPLTAHNGVIYHYGASLTPGARYYLSADNAGQLVATATTGGTAPCALAVDATRIYVMTPSA